MKDLLQVIKDRKQLLENSDLSLCMKDTNTPVEDRMKFIPSMLFFVMGFKDILESLEDKNSTDPIQKKVNIHCLEDEGHWRWYLNDLTTLGFENSYLEKPKAKMFETLWSDNYKAMREMIYQTIHYCKLSKNIPGVKLVIVEVLEAAFAAFLLNMHKLIKEAGLFGELQYFGKRHQDQEDNHSIGSWLEDTDQKATLETDIPQEHLAFAHEAVNNLFDHFDVMFACWYKHQQAVSAEQAVM